MAPQPLPRRLIVVHAGAEAFAPMTRVILAKLGYVLLDAAEFEAREEAGELDRPDLRIVDERCLAEVPEDGGPPAPIVLLTGRHGVTGADPRIVGALRRPAGMHEIYRLVQQVLEEKPRSMPRVPTHLNGRCVRDGREWLCVVLSISENGCLLRSPEPLLLGSCLELRLELPRRGPLALEAEVAYQLVPDFGLVFGATRPAERAALGAYVSEALAAS